MARTASVQRTAFEPPQALTDANVAQVPALDAPAPVPPAALAKPLPRAIVMDEPIGWMENGVLRQFHGEQMVTNAADIRRIAELGGIYFEVAA